jgi:plasmid stabilization system protein ParE
VRGVWTPEAQQDRADAWDYLATDNPRAAARMEEIFSDVSRSSRLVEAGTVDRRRYEQMELACQVARIARHHHHIHAFNSIRLIGEEMVY